MIGKLVATSLLVLGIGAGVHAVADTGPDRPGNDDRYFHGTIASVSYVADDSVVVYIDFGHGDAQEHILADVAPRNRATNTCGTWKPGSWMDDEDTWLGKVGEPELEKQVERLLPKGTKVEGYLTNPESDGLDHWSLQEIATGDGNTIEATSYLHLGSVEGTSVSEMLVATGWAEAWSDAAPGLDLSDSVVARKHDAVVAVELNRVRKPADVTCANRERKAEHRREERHRHWVAGAAARREQARREKRENDLFWAKLIAADAHNHTGGGGSSSSGGDPNYCPPGGCR
jgi:hypothetical protein